MGLNRELRGAVSGRGDSNDRRSREELERVDEVAGLAERAPSTTPEIVHPTRAGYPAGGNAVARDKRPFIAECVSKTSNEGREKAVESDGEQAFALRRCMRDALQILDSEHERLLTKDVLARREG